MPIVDHVARDLPFTLQYNNRDLPFDEATTQRSHVHAGATS